MPVQVRRATNLCIEKDEKKREEIETVRKTTIQQSFAAPATNVLKTEEDEAGTDEDDIDTGERPGTESGVGVGAVEEVDEREEDVDGREVDIDERVDERVEAELRRSRAHYRFPPLPMHPCILI